MEGMKLGRQMCLGQNYGETKRLHLSPKEQSVGILTVERADDRGAHSAPGHDCQLGNYKGQHCTLPSTVLAQIAHPEHLQRRRHRN